ncbi:hypothetical protein [Gordonia phthalatica]|uniref:hypothetical protein n=1 Tax=Gordonia phthalatica TaxID=1136941 RepID=UPI000AF71976|nr:hypothetical protein [Gordonia phthalatica]
MNSDQGVKWPTRQEIAAGESKVVRLRVFLVVVGILLFPSSMLAATVAHESKSWLMYSGGAISMMLLSIILVTMGVYPVAGRSLKSADSVMRGDHPGCLLRSPAITMIGFRLIGLALGVSALSTLVLAIIDGGFGELDGRMIAATMMSIPLSLVILIGTAWNGGRPLWLTLDGGILRADLVDGNVRLDISGGRRDIVVDLVWGYIVQVRTVDGPVARKFHPTFGRKGGKESIFMINPLLYGVDIATVTSVLAEGLTRSEP